MYMYVLSYYTCAIKDHCRTMSRDVDVIRFLLMGSVKFIKNL